MLPPKVPKRLPFILRVKCKILLVLMLLDIVVIRAIISALAHDINHNVGLYILQVFALRSVSFRVAAPTVAFVKAYCWHASYVCYTRLALGGERVWVYVLCDDSRDREGELDEAESSGGFDNAIDTLVPSSAGTTVGWFRRNTLTVLSVVSTKLVSQPFRKAKDCI